AKAAAAPAPAPAAPSAPPASPAPSGAGAAPRHADDAVTVETPLIKRVVRPDDVTQTVPVPKVDPAAAPPADAAETAVLPPVRATDDTAVLPPVRPTDETAVLPPVRPDGGREGRARSDRGSRADGPQAAAGPARSASRPTAQRPPENPADRVPPGIFRDSDNDRTRELPVVGEDGPPRRGRSDWAEETPLDDLPTLADELLGRHHEPGEDEDNGRGPRRRR
ncbi:dTMP kinase, partial [Streptomyces sp. NPDC058728]